MQTTTFAAAVGEFLRAYRQEHGIKLESIAQLGREFGATWSLSSVQSIESGRAAPTLPTLLTLALVLGRLSGEPLRLSDLIGPAEALDRPFIGTPDQPVLRPWVERVLSGGKVELSDTDYKHFQENRALDGDEDVEQSAVQRSNGPLTGEERHAHVDALWDAMNVPPAPSEHRNSRSARASLAESRAAKKLGVGPLEVQRLAIGLWGRLLEAEAISRAGDDSTPQARGRVTRVLVDELRNSMKEKF